ncbi:MAG: phage holin family protein [Acidobacteriota bacterium]
MTDSTESSESPDANGGGLGRSLRALAATMMAIFQTRLALLTTELEEEKQRLLATMAWGAVAILMGCFALAFFALFVAVMFWDSHRLLALGSMGLLFLALCAGACWQVRSLSRASAGLLAATLAEVEADRQALSPGSPP